MAERKGVWTGMGPYLPWSLELWTQPTMVVGGSGGGFKGHTEHAENSVPFKVPSERAQLTPGTNKSRGMRPG